MFHKVKEVKAIEDFKLQVCFDDKTVKIYDVVPLFDKCNVFEALRNNKDLFYAVKVDAGGYGISWNDEIDLSCNELWENGASVESKAVIQELFANYEGTYKCVEISTSGAIGKEL
jgi:hypothetical protein